MVGSVAGGACQRRDVRRFGRQRRVDRLVRLGQLESRQQPDHRPGGIELTALDAELRTARKPVVVVVEPFAAGQPGDESNVGRRVGEILVADVMAESIDRG